MADAAKKPEFHTVTFRARGKKRMTVVEDQTLLDMMRKVGRPLTINVVAHSGGAGELLGAFMLPNNNVVEILKVSDGTEKGYVFANLDVWMTFDAAVDYE